MDEKLAAHFENRIYYFYVTAKEPAEVIISMYGTRYMFIKKEDKWVNHVNNKMNMVVGLINAVLTTLNIPV
jgi:hypothetical protein